MKKSTKIFREEVCIKSCYVSFTDCKGKCLVFRCYNKSIKEMEE